MTNSSTSSTSESTQVRKTVSFSKKRDKDLIGLNELQDDFSYNAKQLMRDGLKFRQLIQSQQLNLSQLSVVPMMESSFEQVNDENEESDNDQEEEINVEVKEPKPSNFQDFLNSKTKKAEISEEDKEKLEKNLDF